MKHTLDKNITGNSNWLETERKRERRMNIFGERDSARFSQMEHEEHCAAEELRLEHEEHCDADELRMLHSTICSLADDYSGSNEEENDPGYSNRNSDSGKARKIIGAVFAFILFVVIANVLIVLFSWFM